MRKKALIFLACLFASASIYAQIQLPTGVTLNQSDTIVLHIDSNTVLRVTVIPDDADDRSVTWEVNPPSSGIIELVPDGNEPECTITGKAEGTARVIVHTNTGNFRDTCIIRVIIPITGMTLNEPSMSLKVDEDSVLIARIVPLHASIPSVEWESLNPAIVSIVPGENPYDTVCYIRAVGVGTASIVAKTVDGEFTDTCKITVGSELIESFALSDDTLRFIIGSDTFLTAHVLPTEGTDKRVIWKIIDNSPHNDIFRINSSGYDTICHITGIGIGMAEIEATVSDGIQTIKDTCVINVRGVELTGIALDNEVLELKIGEDTTIVATLLPNPYVDDDSITWTSSDSSVVDILSVTGQTVCAIRAGFSGDAYIVAKTFDGGFEAVCYVRVVVPTDSIVLSADTMLIAIDSLTARLDVTFYPDTATKDPPVWTIENPTLLTLASSDEGDTIMTLHPLALGTTQIYVEAANGMRDTCLVTIRLDSVKIDVPTDTIELSLNTTDTLKTIIYPYATTGYLFEWTSRDSLIVDIVATPGDSACVIKGLQADTATIYLRDADSGSLDSCVVKVVDKAIVSVALDTLNLTLAKGESYTLQAIITPADASNDTLKWTIENEQVVDTVFNAEASDTLRITGKYEGTTKIYVVSVSDETKKDSCLVQVYIPIDSVVFDQQEMRLLVDSTASLKVTAYPDSAAMQPFVWEIEDKTLVDSVSMDGDSISMLKALKLGETRIFVSTLDGLRKDTCVIKTLSNELVIAIDTTDNNNGRIELSLMLPDDVSFRGAFKVQFPDGFYVLEDSCEMIDPYKATDTLIVAEEADNTWLFTVQPRVGTTQLTLRSGTTLKRVVSIAYTVHKALNDSKDKYSVKFMEMDFTLSDDSEIRKDLILLPIKAYVNPTANEMVTGAPETGYAYVTDGNLYVHSAKNETIRVYSASGALLTVRQKAEGQAVVRIHTREKVLIVTGSSGWTQKVSNTSSN